MADEPAPANSKQILMQKIYVKDMSFESPKAPDIFMANPQANTQLNIGTKNQRLQDDVFEVTLTLTVQSKSGDDTLFLIEIAQAGIFTLRGYTDEERHVLLGTFCPGSLYPFAREAVAEIAGKGGFPPLLLQPINFDAVYAQAVQQRQAAAAQPASIPAGGEAAEGVEMSAGSSSRGNGETH
jgi:preprotein translocase subunit SecB